MEDLDLTPDIARNTELISPAVLGELVLMTTSDAVIASSFDRIILSWNQGAERIFGYSAREMVGKQFDFLIPAEERNRVREAMERVEHGESPVQYEATRFAKDGTRIELSVSLSPLWDSTGEFRGVVSISRDVSAQRRAERELASRLRRQASLAFLGQRALSGIDLDTLLQDAVTVVQSTLEVDFVKILELQTDGRHLRMQAGAGWCDGVVGNAVFGAEFESQAGFTLLSDKPVIVQDLTQENRFHAPNLLLEHDVVSGITTIIDGITPDQPYGVIGAHTRESRTFTLDDIHFLETVATMLASGIRQARATVDRTARLKAEDSLREAELAAQQRTILLETASRVALDILSSRIGVEALRYIAEAARVLAGARYAALGVAHIGKPGLEQFISVGFTPEEETLIGDLPRGAGVLGVLLEREQPLRLAKISDHPASVGFPPHHRAMTSFLGVPVRRGDVTLGSLYLTNKQGGGEFTEADEVAVEALGTYAGVIIHHLRMLSRQKDLTRSLLTAQEEERRAVAHDLHDGVTQYIMAAHAHLEAYKRAHAAGNQERALLQVEKGAKYLYDAVVESRRMINNLRLLVLDDLGLIGALEQLLQEEIIRAGWEEAHLDENINAERFDFPIETTIYRVAQESLTNARKYAESERVRLSLRKESVGRASYLRLEVQDWGKGFVADERIGAPGHFGLQGMAERVQFLNGTCKFRTHPGNGTTVTVVLPLEK